MKVINQFLQESEDRDYSKRDSAKAIIIDEEGKVLIVRINEEMGGAGMWDIPGGGIEKGETAEQALKREVFEETGLKIKNIKSYKTIQLKIPEKGVNANMKLYKCTPETTDITLKPTDWKEKDNVPEHNETKWIYYDHELKNLPMIDQMKNVIIPLLKKQN